MKKKVFFGLIVLTLVAAFILSACTTTGGPTEPTETETSPPTKDKIVIGAARPMSGANAQIAQAAFDPIMEMWQEEVNAEGGIYVEEYGKKLPIEYKIYDDKTDVGTMVRLTEKLIVEDKVDILFPSCGTAFISAQAPIANKYGYVLLTAEGGATTMTEALPALPYVFVSLPYSDNYQLPVLADMLAAQGAKTAYIVYIADLHGIEYNGIAGTEFGRVGIDIVASKSVPITQEDFSIIMKDAKAADADVFCAFGYPPIVSGCTKEAISIGFNPDAFVAGPGGNFGYYPAALAGVEDPSGVNGVTVFAAANRKTSPEFKELYDKLEGMENVGAMNLDFWGHPYYAPIVEIWQQAIEETGTLDQDTLRDYIATNHFDTILGDTYFEIFGNGGGLLAKESHPGEIGQWQDGVVEIVGGGDWPATTLTGEFIYPKPEWPTK